MDHPKLNSLIMNAEIACGATGFSTISELAPLVSLFGEGVRQLTRIADQGDKIVSPTLLQKLDRLNLFLKHAVDESSILRKPTPDVPTVALVEAVKHVIKRLNIGFTQKDAIFHLEQAIAAYEKEKSHE